MTPPRCCASSSPAAKPRQCQEKKRSAPCPPSTSWTMARLPTWRVTSATPGTTARRRSAPQTFTACAGHSRTDGPAGLSHVDPAREQIDRDSEKYQIGGDPHQEPCNLLVLKWCEAEPGSVLARHHANRAGREEHHHTGKVSNDRSRHHH